MRLDVYYYLAPKIPKSELDYLISEVLDIPKGGLAFAPEPDLETNRSILAAIQELKTGMPAQYIIGRAWFYGLCYQVNPQVLIPRFDTEVLVEAVQKYLPKSGRFLDIGTGSGVIAITLKKHFPDVEMHATEISPGALEIAKINAKKHNAKIEFHYSSLFPKEPMSFDLIISNPPYISKKEYESLPASIRDYEPASAFLAGEDGLDYFKAICQVAEKYLNKDGVLAFEHGKDQQRDLESLTKKAGFRTLEAGSDLAGLDRYLIAVKRG